MVRRLGCCKGGVRVVERYFVATSPTCIVHCFPLDGSSRCLRRPKHSRRHDRARHAVPRRWPRNVQAGRRCHSRMCPSSRHRERRRRPPAVSRREAVEVPRLWTWVESLWIWICSEIWVEGAPFSSCFSWAFSLEHFL